MRRFWGKQVTIVFSANFGRGTKAIVDQYRFWMKSSVAYICDSSCAVDENTSWIAWDQPGTGRPSLYTLKLITDAIKALEKYPGYYEEKITAYYEQQRQERRRREREAYLGRRPANPPAFQPRTLHHLDTSSGSRRASDPVYLSPAPAPRDDKPYDTGLTDLMGAAIGSMVRHASEPIPAPERTFESGRGGDFGGGGAQDSWADPAPAPVYECRRDDPPPPPAYDPPSDPPASDTSSSDISSSSSTD